MTIPQLALAFAASLLLGLRHATDPDHLVAVAAIVSREGAARRARHIGVLWGLGHTLTLLVVGGLIIATRVTLAGRPGMALELAVAVMLIVLGLLNLRAARMPGAGVPAAQPFLVGVVHGLAGSAAAALLIVPLIGDPRWAVAYLLVFGGGTVAGMALMSVVLAAPAALAARRLHGLERPLRLASGALSFGFGAYLFIRIGWLDGLFTRLPG